MAFREVRIYLNGAFTGFLRPFEKTFGAVVEREVVEGERIIRFESDRLLKCLFSFVELPLCSVYLAHQAIGLRIIGAGFESLPAGADRLFCVAAAKLNRRDSEIGFWIVGTH